MINLVVACFTGILVAVSIHMGLNKKKIVVP